MLRTGIYGFRNRTETCLYSETVVLDNHVKLGTAKYTLPTLSSTNSQNQVYHLPVSDPQFPCKRKVRERFEAESGTHLLLPNYFEVSEMSTSAV